MTDPVDNKAMIVQRLLEASRQLTALGVMRISLFGSFMRGQQCPSSDVDVLVQFAPDKHTFDSFMEISFFLEDLLGRRVEVVTPEALSPHIGPHILQEAEHVPVAD